MTAEITNSMDQVLDHLVGRVPGVVSAVVSSADGFTLAARIPDDSDVEPASLGAMAAAALALSNRLVSAAGETTTTVAIHRSDEGQVVILPISDLAVLTMMAVPDVDSEQLGRVGIEATAGLLRLFRGAASV